MRRGLLATRDELTDLRKRVRRKPFDQIHRTLRRRCDLILETAPVSEMQWRTEWDRGVWGAALQAARTTQGRMLDLLIAHHVDGNGAYRDRAIEELESLIRWGTWTDPCHRGPAADLCTAEAATAAAVALDWMWEDVDETFRARVLKAIVTRGIEPYRKAVAARAWWYSCYHNWNAVVNGGCGLAALALSDESPEAAEAYDSARAGLKHFFDALGPEGGWDEGTGHWGYAMRYVLLLGCACGRVLDDQSLLHQRGMSATGAFGVHFTPNGQPASFGEAAAVPLHGALYLLTQYHDSRELLWWLDTYSFHRDVSTSGWSAAGLALLFRPAKRPVPRDPKLRELKVFPDIGWAVMADRWPRPALFVSAKSGDLAANHSHHDTNAVHVQSDGEMLLTDAGSPAYTGEYFSDARRGFYQVQARAHNTLIVGRRDHQPDTQGAIPAWREGGDWRWITCDANGACGDAVRFFRNVVMLAPSGQAATVVVLDEVHNPVAERIDLFWHTHGSFELGGDPPVGRVLGNTATLNIALAASGEYRWTVHRRSLGNNHREHVLHVRTGKETHAMFLTVLSRRRITRVAIEPGIDTVGVRVAGTRVHFRRRGAVLEPHSITRD